MPQVHAAPPVSQHSREGTSTCKGFAPDFAASLHDLSAQQYLSTAHSFVDDLASHLQAAVSLSVSEPAQAVVLPKGLGGSQQRSYSNDETPSRSVRCDSGGIA